jgi:hypothetical protein
MVSAHHGSCLFVYSAVSSLTKAISCPTLPSLDYHPTGRNRFEGSPVLGRYSPIFQKRRFAIRSVSAARSVGCA